MERRALIMMVFRDRVDAGRQLAQRLSYLRDEDLVVLGLPRGGVPVAFAVAEALDAPLDVIVVCKLGVPFQPELAMGAIGEDGTLVLDTDVLAGARINDDELRAVERAAQVQLAGRVARYRKGLARVDLRGRTAVVVDDGMATGSTARAACQVAKNLGAATVVLAVPVASADVVRHFTDADRVICVSCEPHLRAVGFHYRDFRPTTDDEVMSLLRTAGGRASDGQVAALPDCDRDVEISIGAISLQGHLHVPEPASGVVLFAHGSGSSRHSPRNRAVADFLFRAGLGTLLLDLLTPAEELDRRMVFDIELLADRLIGATEWLATQPETASCRVGYFGASTGAGAALWAAASAGSEIAAVVSRGGRPDLAEPCLPKVQAPTLLIVGGNDDSTLRLNRRAQTRLRCPCSLIVVQGAGHLFEEPGTLVEVANLARDWFIRYLLPANQA
jgi:putative phosphoribosyl transferase